MDLCRVCLSRNSDKDISELDLVNKGQKVTYVDVMLFCLNIQVTEDTKITRKLCKKCSNKIRRYYEFKLLAQQNDVYLKSISPSIVVKNEVFIEEEKNGINFENNDNNLEDVDFKCVLKEEFNDSDDELLIGFKHFSENVDNFKENVSVQSSTVAENIEEFKKKGQRKNLRTKAKTTKTTYQICEECGKTVKNMRTHRLTHLPKSNPFSPQCDICAKVFATIPSMRRHRKNKHLSVLKHCEICDKDVRKLEVHQRVAHNKSSLRHVCPTCDKRYISKSALDTHMLAHTNERPFACDFCPGKYKQKVMLEQHIKQVHNKEKPHMCQFCSKSFFKKYHLQIHIRMHTKEKPYKCKECGCMFRSTTSLRNHQSVHSDVKNFACTLCDMTFSRKGYLTMHMAVHSREKRHPCKYCGVKFRRSDHRKRHEYTAHEKHLITAVEPIAL